MPTTQYQSKLYLHGTNLNKDILIYYGLLRHIALVNLIALIGGHEF